MKNNKYELAVFDVDGTLLDTKEGIFSSVKYTIDHFGFEKLSDEKLSNFIGPPVQDSFAKAYGFEGAFLQEIATVFRNRYSEVDLLKAEPYEGIYEVLKGLRDREIRIAVATYKRHDYAVKILKHFGFDNYTNVYFGADHENKLKKKDIIEKCITVSGISDRSKAVMIGDSDNDAIGAQKAGLDFIGVTYGYGFKSKADCNEFPNVGVASTPEEILDLV